MGQGTGEANALYWLRRGEHVWVLRRPPAVINAPGASDMGREWRILVALEGGRRDLAFALVDALADLAAVPWRERGLDGLGRPEGFLDRQVSRWLGQLDGYRTRDIPGLDRLAGWLEGSPLEAPPHV